MRLEPLRLPNLKLVPEPDEARGVLDPRMRLEILGQNDAPFRIRLQRFAPPIERRGELLALFGVRRIALDQRFDFRQERIAARVERGPVERRMTIKSLVAVPREHRAETGWNRDSALGVEAHGEGRYKAVHGAARRVNEGLPDTPTLGKTYTGTGYLGISWVLMVRQRNRRCCPRLH